MNREHHEQDLIKKYLLRELAEGELEIVEQRLMTDREFYERVLIAEDELADDYAQRGLSTSDRKQFERSLLATERGQKQVALSRTISKYVKAQGQPSIFNRALLFLCRIIGATPRQAGVIVALAIIGAASFAVWRVLAPGSKLQEASRALIAAYRDSRPVQARISNFDYSRWGETRGQGQDKTDYSALEYAKTLLLEEVTKNPSPAAHHDLGRFYLAGQDFNKAIDQFTQALESDLNNGRLHADLGAALLEQGKTELNSDEPAQGFEKLANSLSHFETALELDSSLLEPLFNIALCHELLNQRDAAKAAWNRYLDKDSISGWAIEAREHLARLDEPQKVSTNPTHLLEEFERAYLAADAAGAQKAIREGNGQTWNFVIDKLLDKYLDQYDRGLKQDAAKTLEAVTFAARSNPPPDRFAAELANFYASAEPSKLSSLMKARKLMKLADESVRRSQPEALAQYSEAASLFDQAGDQCELEYARYRVAGCYLRKPDFTLALEVLSPLAATCRLNRHLGLQARALHSMAYAAQALNRRSEGLSYSRTALEIAKAIDDRAWIVRSCSQLALAHQKLGDTRESLSYVQQGLSEADWPPLNPDYRSEVYDAAADAFTLAGFHKCAIRYQEESLSIKIKTGNPFVISRSYAHLGMMYAKLSEFDEAQNNLSRSLETASGVSDEALIRDIKAFAFLRIGYLHWIRGDPSMALEYYNKNLEIYDYLAPEGYFAHKGRLSCYMALGDDASAENELRVVLKLFENNRSKISEERSRNTFFDLEQGTYDKAIDFAYSRLNDPGTALGYSEASRARSLLDLTNDNTRVRTSDRRRLPVLELAAVERPLGLAEIQARLPEDVQLLVYAVLDDKTLVWVVSKRSIECRHAAIESSVLVSRVNQYLHAISEQDDQAADTVHMSKELYSVLIAPVKDILSRDKWIFIIPDKIVNYIPFNALVSPSSGGFLIQEYKIAFSPSSTIFVKSCEIAKRKEKISDEQLLAVGDPTFDSDLYRLPYLPDSKYEAQEISRFYRESLVFTGTRAREQEIYKHIRRADVIHLSTHYVADARSPLLSGLLLAKEGVKLGTNSEPDGVMQAHEVYAMKPLAARLAVLAACQTFVEELYRGEGAVGLARPFISAGVPLVIASLWPVDSRATERLMIKFHKHRKLGGLSTANALRQAQLDLIDDSSMRFREPYYWAGFMLVGAHANF